MRGARRFPFTVAVRRRLTQFPDQSRDCIPARTRSDASEDMR